jgi:hypothetical protein
MYIDIHTAKLIVSSSIAIMSDVICCRDNIHIPLEFEGNVAFAYLFWLTFVSQMSFPIRYQHFRLIFEQLVSMILDAF